MLITFYVQFFNVVFMLEMFQCWNTQYCGVMWGSTVNSEIYLWAFYYFWIYYFWQFLYVSTPNNFLNKSVSSWIFLKFTNLKPHIYIYIYIFNFIVRRSPMCNQPSINKATITGKRNYYNPSVSVWKNPHLINLTAYKHVLLHP